MTCNQKQNIIDSLYIIGLCTMCSILKIEHISKKFNNNVILNDISFEMKPQKITSLIGKSGSGKTTLLHIAGLLETTDSGAILINSKNCIHMTDTEKNNFRKKYISFIFQNHFLMPEFNVIENIAIAQMIQGNNKKIAYDNSSKILVQLKLEYIAQSKIQTLSGGEKQRIAVARALVTKPQIIIADEPTGNLDEETAQEIFTLLKKISVEYDISILMATHNLSLANQSDYRLELKDKLLYEH